MKFLLNVSVKNFRGIFMQASGKISRDFTELLTRLRRREWIDWASQWTDSGSACDELPDQWRRHDVDRWTPSQVDCLQTTTTVMYLTQRQLRSYSKHGRIYSPPYPRKQDW